MDNYTNITCQLIMLYNNQSYEVVRVGYWNKKEVLICYRYSNFMFPLFKPENDSTNQELVF